jgi:D-3-phosphoglycerate dehydrogenase
VKVLVADNISDAGLKNLADTEGIQVDKKVGLSPEELIRTIGDYEALAVRGATKVTAEVIAAGTKLQVIGRAGTGLDNVDIQAATKRGIVVMNTPGGNSVTTAEHTVSMMLALARNIPQAHASLKAGLWEKKKFGGTEVYGKTLGVVGLGKIGAIVADRATGLEMNVVAYDPILSEDQAKQCGARLASLDEVFAEADFLTFHVPLTDHTREMVNKDNIAKMKDGVRIINCSRGPVINEEDLADAVESGKVAGVALDVYPVEPPENRRLIDNERVICTPHLGASTKEAQENVAVAIADQIRDFLVNGTIRNAVNAPAVAGETLAALQPYIDLGGRLGHFLSQMVQTGITSIEAAYAGDPGDLDFKPITNSFLAGLLTPFMKEDINQVNAPVVAKDRGIVISETRTSRTESFTSLLQFTVTTERRSHVVEGTIFGRSEPRMVRYGVYRGEFDLSGNLLLIQAMDRPGVIGAIGQLLGTKGVNISHFQFARAEPGGEALLFLNTDSEADEAAIKDLQGIENIEWVRPLTM